MSLHDGRALSAANQLELWDASSADQIEGLRVVRRDGRESPFDVSVLSKSILRAGWPGEALDPDTVSSLSHAVLLYLRHSNAQPVSVAMLRQTVERLLIDMGYTLTARMYAGAFAPSSTADSHGGMFDESLSAERAERLLAAAAAETGLERAEAESVVAEVLRQIAAAGVQQLTPGLLREWMRSEFRTRGLLDAASKLARISMPISALHDAFAETEDAPLIAPTDPEGAALALASRVSAAYVLGQLMPAAVGQAHVRGDIQIRGVGNFLRLDSIAMDLEGLKECGPLSTTMTYAPAENPRALIKHIRIQNETLTHFFGGDISWSAINFSIAPYLAGRSDDEIRDVVRNVLFEVSEFAHRATARSGAPEFCLAWDAPDDFPAQLLGPGDALMPLADSYDDARRFFGEMLSETARLSDEGRVHDSVRLALHLSPYFFGAPDADQHLERIARIAKGGVPLVLRYTPASSLMFDDPSARQSAAVTAQTVSVFAARAAKLTVGLDAFLARLDATIDTGIAAHRTKRAFLEKVLMQRNGPLALLKRTYAGTPFAQLEAMQYRMAVSGLGHTALARAGIKWLAPGEELIVAEMALDRIKQSCARWTTATGQHFMLTGADTDRIGVRAGTRPTETLALEAQLHPLYDVAPPFNVSGETFGNAADIAAFIRHAFLHTSCRALRFV